MGFRGTLWGPEGSIGTEIALGAYDPLTLRRGKDSSLAQASSDAACREIGPIMKKISIE
jgi:hypothetical protein